MKRTTRLVLRIVVGALILAFVLSRAHLSQLTIRMDGRLALALVGTAALLLVAQGVSAFRWTRILGRGAPLWLYLWRLYAIGAFFSLFLPTVVGGDGVRALALARQRRPGEVVASVLIDRGFGVLALVLYLIIGNIVAPDLLAPVRTAARWKLSAGVTAALVLGLLVGSALALVLARRSERLRVLWTDALTLCVDLLRRPLDLVLSLLAGFVVQGAYIAAWMVLAVGLRFAFPIPVFLVAVPVVSLATMLPITFAGIGLREGAWLLMLKNTAVAKADIVVFSLLYFGAVLFVGALGGLLFMFRGTELAKGAPDAGAGSPEGLKSLSPQ